MSQPICINYVPLNHTSGGSIGGSRGWVQGKHFQNTTHCIINISDESLCAVNPCLHGGTCVSGVYKYTCECATDLYGAECQHGQSCSSISYIYFTETIYIQFIQSSHSFNLIKSNSFVQRQNIMIIFTAVYHTSFQNSEQTTSISFNKTEILVLIYVIRYNNNNNNLYLKITIHFIILHYIQ